MRPVVDRAGQRFGRLQVLKEAGRDKHGHVTWLCLCDCGSETVVLSSNLGSGGTTSCGCYVRSIYGLNGKKGADKIRGVNSPFYKEVVGYTAMHYRIRSARGSAKTQACVDCGNPANHWSYDLSDSEPLVDKGLTFSLDMNRYEPRCSHCHSVHDRKEQTNRE